MLVVSGGLYQLQFTAILMSVVLFVSGLYQSHKEAIHKLFRVLINLM